VRLAPVDTQRLDLRLPAEAKSLSLMRQSLERWLSAAGVHGDDIYEITVACGEACMNAVEHAYPPGDAVFVVTGSIAGGELELVVRDFGFWRPPRRDTDRGRGIGLMKRLMDAAQISPGPSGTTVRLRRAVRQRAEMAA
jgi:anti-sigma regulatory factor (Ser/Thr protein kinase)